MIPTYWVGSSTDEPREADNFRGQNAAAFCHDYYHGHGQSMFDTTTLPLYPDQAIFIVGGRRSIASDFMSTFSDHSVVSQDGNLGAAVWKVSRFGHKTKRIVMIFCSSHGPTGGDARIVNFSEPEVGFGFILTQLEMLW